MKPAQLMMGKIIGVVLVAGAQVAIWGVLLCLMSGLLLPALIPDSLMAQMNAMNAGAMPDGLGGEDAEMLQDTVLAAVNEMLARAQEVTNRQLGAVTGGMNMPGMPGMF